MEGLGGGQQIQTTSRRKPNGGIMEVAEARANGGFVRPKHRPKIELVGARVNVTLLHTDTWESVLRRAYPGGGAKYYLGSPIVPGTVFHFLVSERFFSG